ncbi:MAG TPA: YIP1 family protein [Vicinamibacteria bacterium]
MSDAGLRPDGASSNAPGFLSNLFGLYFGPREAFGEIVKRPSFWLPLALFMALQVGFTAVWLQKMDVMEFLRSQAEASGQPFQAPPPQAMGFVRGTFWVIALLTGPIFMAAAGGLYLFIFRFFLASEMTFKQSMGIVTHTFAATALVTTPLMLLVFALKGDWNVPPQELLQANPTVFFEKEDVAKPLWALLSSIDLFSFWALFLLAVGFGVASKRATGSAFWGAAAPWLLYVVGKVAFAFF